jgi:hypothetical protein
MDESKNIATELKATAPMLSSLPKKNPFEVPEGYFDELEESIRVAAGIEPAKELQARPHENPLTVPPGYFENLPAAIVQKAGSRKPGGVIRSMKKRWWAVAASAAAILIVSIPVLRNHTAETLASGNPIDTTYLLLENATGLPDAMVVELYNIDNPSASSDSLQHEYLIEASGIDAETILSL